MKERNPDVHIYLIGFYNPLEQYFGHIEDLEMIVTNWNEAGKALQKNLNTSATFQQRTFLSSSDTKLLADDQFHSDTTGYKRMAERILEEMKELEIDMDITITDD